ncbi:multicopper oxidase-domain-containing protein [Armillaria mellea]|nr:multicopper oxidase-domain-containing protein [Armillaria mellea]
MTSSSNVTAIRSRLICAGQPETLSLRLLLTLGSTVLDGALVSGNKGGVFQLSRILQISSIHWHGLLQKADNPAFVNQCRIAKGNPCLYTVESTNQPRTCWYHSHLSTQYCDGLRGPFVIYNPNDPHSDLYDVDDKSTILTLPDGDHTPAKELKFPTPELTLINGLRRSFITLTCSGVVLLTCFADGAKILRLTWLLSLLSKGNDMACDSAFTFAIEGHAMSIIDVDNVNHEPYTVYQIQIFASQRYSFVLTANQKVDNYWIRALPSVGTSRYTNGINSASILRYSGGPEVEPATATI